jgi:peptide/nickel transport system permease protein
MPRTTGVLLSYTIFALIAIMVISNTLFTFDPFDNDLALRAAKPSWDHPLGCDLFGRDLLKALCAGAKHTITIAMLTVLCSGTIGTLFGLISGYFRGPIDFLLMRATEVVMAFPGILLSMALAGILGPSEANVVIAISATGWASFARMIRNQLLSVREEEFILACEAMGASNVRIIFKHLLPTQIPTLLVLTTFSLAGVILTEASLSFLGFGTSAEVPTWGYLLNQGRSVLTHSPHLSLIPGLLIFLLILSINNFGDRLQHAKT